MSKIKVRIKRPPTRLAFITMFFVVFALITGALCLTSCNVTRKITTQSEYVQHGDTNVVIVTKTIESYDASKKVPSL